MKENILAKEVRLLGYTQEELADELGIATNSFSPWISGKRKISGKMVRLLRGKGISQKAIENPTQEV